MFCDSDHFHFALCALFFTLFMANKASQKGLIVAQKEGSLHLFGKNTAVYCICSLATQHNLTHLNYDAFDGTRLLPRVWVVMLLVVIISDCIIEHLTLCCGSYVGTAATDP